MRHRGQARPCAPARKARQRLIGGTRAGSRGHDDFGVGSEHRLVRHGRHQRREPREHVAAAAQRDHLAEQTRPVQRHERAIPDLIEHRHGRPRRVARAQLRDRVAIVRGRRLRARLRAEQLAEARERGRDVVERARFAEEQRNAERAQSVGLALRVAMAPDHDQIGLQRGDAFEVERAVVADARHALGCGRVVAVVHGAHQFGAAAGRIDEFGRMRREADHALRGRGERDGRAAVVDDGDACAGGGCAG